MKANESERFPWSLLFFVTSLCFTVFSQLIQLINASSSHVSIFLKTGIFFLLLSILSFMAKLFVNTPEAETDTSSPI